MLSAFYKSCLEPEYTTILFRFVLLPQGGLEQVDIGVCCAEGGVVATLKNFVVDLAKKVELV